jgi:predicted metal-dependent enzyme (double-stranded beta helix superfamily)
MYTLDSLLDDLRYALRTNDLAAVAEIVHNAILAKPFVKQGSSSRLLHSEPGLTVLHVVVNPGFVSPQHDHHTWAVIGVYDGQEDNTFYRLIEGSRRIEEIGRRNVGQGEVLTLGTEAIHQIANPRTEKLVALHVYGKNIFEIERSAWDPATGNERAFKLFVDARGAVRS